MRCATRWPWPGWRSLDVPFTSLAGQRAQLARLKQDGYQVVFSRGAYLVLHRPQDLMVRERR